MNSKVTNVGEAERTKKKTILKNEKKNSATLFRNLKNFVRENVEQFATESLTLLIS